MSGARDGSRARRHAERRRANGPVSQVLSGGATPPAGGRRRAPKPPIVATDGSFSQFPLALRLPPVLPRTVLWECNQTGLASGLPWPQYYAIAFGCGTGVIETARGLISGKTHVRNKRSPFPLPGCPARGRRGARAGSANQRPGSADGHAPLRHVGQRPGGGSRRAASRSSRRAGWNQAAAGDAAPATQRGPGTAHAAGPGAGLPRAGGGGHGDIDQPRHPAGPLGPDRRPDAQQAGPEHHGRGHRRVARRAARRMAPGRPDRSRHRERRTRRRRLQAGAATTGGHAPHRGPRAPPRPGSMAIPRTRNGTDGWAGGCAQGGGGQRARASEQCARRPGETGVPTGFSDFAGGRPLPGSLRLPTVSKGLEGVPGGAAIRWSWVWRVRGWEPPGRRPPGTGR